MVAAGNWEGRGAVACRVEEPKEEREVDGSGQVYMTVAELKEQEARRRAGRLMVRLGLECITLSMPCMVQVL